MSLLCPRVILHSWGSGLLCVWQPPACTGTLIDLGLPRAPPRGNFTISCEERTTVPFHSEDTGTWDIQVIYKAHRQTQILTYMKSSGSFAPTSTAEPGMMKSFTWLNFLLASNLVLDRGHSSLCYVMGVLS